MANLSSLVTFVVNFFYSPIKISGHMPRFSRDKIYDIPAAWILFILPFVRLNLHWSSHHTWLVWPPTVPGRVGEAFWTLEVFFFFFPYRFWNPLFRQPQPPIFSCLSLFRLLSIFTLRVSMVRFRLWKSCEWWRNNYWSIT